MQRLEVLAVLLLLFTTVCSLPRPKRDNSDYDDKVNYEQAPGKDVDHSNTSTLQEDMDVEQARYYYGYYRPYPGYYGGYYGYRPYFNYGYLPYFYG